MKHSPLIVYNQNQFEDALKAARENEGEGIRHYFVLANISYANRSGFFARDSEDSVLSALKHLLDEETIIYSIKSGECFFNLKTELHGQAFKDSLERLLKKVAYLLDQNGYLETMNFLVYDAQQNDEDLNHILAVIDYARYKQEQHVHQIIYIDETLVEDMNQEIEVYRDLMAANIEDEFQLYYQPIVDANTAGLIGCEALLRWNHPEKGLLSPGLFIGILEESRLIFDVTLWITEQVLKEMSLWKQQGLPMIRVSINFVTAQLEAPGIAQVLIGLLDKYKISPSLIKIEVTERLHAKNIEHMRSNLTQLQEYGLKIVVDDFGTGHSAIQYLQQLPIDFLKIDKSFIDDVEQPAHRRLVKSIVAMAHSLGINVVAEGVETQAQADIVREIGCDEIQGYFYGRPMTMHQFVECLKHEQSDIELF